MDVHEWFDNNLAVKLIDPPREGESAFEAFKRTIETAVASQGSEMFRRILASILLEDPEGTRQLPALMHEAFRLLAPEDIDASLIRVDYRTGPDRVRTDYDEFERDVDVSQG